MSTALCCKCSAPLGSGDIRASKCCHVFHYSCIGTLLNKPCPYNCGDIITDRGIQLFLPVEEEDDNQPNWDDKIAALEREVEDVVQSIQESKDRTCAHKLSTSELTEEMRSMEECASLKLQTVEHLLTKKQDHEREWQQLCQEWQRCSERWDKLAPLHCVYKLESMKGLNSSVCSQVLAQIVEEDENPLATLSLFFKRLEQRQKEQFATNEAREEEQDTLRFHKSVLDRKLSTLRKEAADTPKKRPPTATHPSPPPPKTPPLDTQMQQQTPPYVDTAPPRDENETTDLQSFELAPIGLVNSKDDPLTALVQQAIAPQKKHHNASSSLLAKRKSKSSSFVGKTALRLPSQATHGAQGTLNFPSFKKRKH